MGALAKAVAGVLGLLMIGGPLWPLGLVCFIYLALVLRRRHRPPGAPSSPTSGTRWRHMLAVTLFLLSALSYLVGGVLSPPVFFLGGCLALLWPVIPGLLPLAEVVPVDDSILLRSKYFPLAWHALGEFKPGTDDFPRALSSFSGTLLVYTDTGRTFALATCLALGRGSAEEELRLQLKSSIPRSGAFLLPLDSEAAGAVLSTSVSRIKLRPQALVDPATRVPGVLVLESRGSTVHRAGVFDLAGTTGKAMMPMRGKEAAGAPLLWEVLEAIGRRTRWPNPDAFSSFLESLTATRGEPLGDRLESIEGTGDEVSVHSLGGPEVRITRSQLRTVVSLYS